MMAIIKKTNNSKCWLGGREIRTLNIDGGNIHGVATVENRRVPQKIKYSYQMTHKFSS